MLLGRMDMIQSQLVTRFLVRLLFCSLIVEILTSSLALSQIVGVVNDTQFWTGVLGLGIKASNFQETKMSLLYSLASGNSSSIPSQSYGYTAGAVYSEFP